MRVLMCGTLLAVASIVFRLRGPWQLPNHAEPPITIYIKSVDLTSSFGMAEINIEAFSPDKIVGGNSTMVCWDTALPTLKVLNTPRPGLKSSSK